MTNHVKLLLNGETSGHLDRFLELIQTSTRFECVVAFARMSGWASIAVPLTAALKRGLHVRFTAGLSFCYTEPAVLQALIKLKQKHDNLQVYIGDTPETFHPKLYAFGNGSNGTVIVGSANLTSGGFTVNYEASVEIDDVGGKLMAEIVDHVDSLIEGKVLQEVTPFLIDDYARKFEINRIHQAVARRRTAKAIARTEVDTDTLQAVLNVLRDDKTENGFDAMVALRKERRRQANLAMQRLIGTPPSTRDAFIAGYEDLIRHFSSGGLQRGKTRIANNYRHFLAALNEAQELKHASPGTAYTVLADYFDDVIGAGVNILTEILLAINSKRFANMNKNAVAGMARANVTRFPERPLKTNVDAELYAEYCEEADRLREQLSLRDFIELDTLFNHLYWN
ncbi:phospholipase D-like domain-containing protein [Telluria mixta]|uniref:Phospholipase D-like domain-containing protein n=1 Tax=Telluria mixta TaxID=34071 RepID=A0ABT2BX25_9BURK|nr:phospholipase D-like domain-containing protein [Telluria mixta]MCS0629660.1 phospholipase D-like domain-containing protein [Telluria mixta]WEM96771.1 phospholipase D-like domain-containing protein [Telluria mixta]